jgi:TolC family type I secretion outer membrane protein
MVKNIKISSYLAGMAFSLMAFQSAYGYNLEDALISAYETNAELQTQEETLGKARAQQLKSLSGFLPSVHYDIGQQKKKYDRPTASPTTIASHKKRYRTNDLQIEQSLFEGGSSLANVYAASKGFSAQESALLAKYNEVTIKVVDAYVDTLTKREIAQRSRKNEEMLQEHLRITEVRFKLGEATKTDLFHAKAALANASARLASDQSNAAAAEAKYEHIVGQPLPADAEVLNHFNLTVPESYDEFLALVISKNPNLAAAKDQRSAKKSAVLASAGAFLPRVSAGITKHKETADRDKDGTSYVVQVKIPIFQQGIEYASLKEARHDSRSAEIHLRDINRALEEQAVSLWSGYKASKLAIQATEEGVKAASEALIGVKEEAKAGTRSTFDVLQTQKEFFDAEVNNLKTIQSYILTIYQMYGMMGDLTKNSKKQP